MYRRPKSSRARVFFTLCLAAPGGDLLCREADALRAAIRDTQAERPFGIAAFVVLPDHLHCIWDLPEGDGDYSTRWGAIKARFSMAMRRAGFTPPPPVGRAHGGVNPALRRKGEIGLWQPRFWDHHIRDETGMENHLRYCWWNPVKHGLVADPADWPFSSIHRDMRAGRVPPEWHAPDKGEFGE